MKARSFVTQHPDLFMMTVAPMAKVGGMPYAKLVEEHAFTPFVRP